MTKKETIEAAWKRFQLTADRYEWKAAKGIKRSLSRIIRLEKKLFKASRLLAGKGEL